MPDFVRGFAHLSLPWLAADMRRFRARREE